MKSTKPLVLGPVGPIKRLPSALEELAKKEDKGMFWKIWRKSLFLLEKDKMFVWKKLGSLLQKKKEKFLLKSWKVGEPMVKPTAESVESFPPGGLSGSGKKPVPLVLATAIETSSQRENRTRR